MLISTDNIHARRFVIEEIQPSIVYPSLFSLSAPVGQNADETPELVKRFRHELVFVDSTTAHYQELIAKIYARSGPDRPIAIKLLDSASDGIKQITSALSGETGIVAIHLVSHGANRTLELGSSRFTINSLADNAAQIATWGQALVPSADFLIYNCDLGNIDNCIVLVDALSRLTTAQAAGMEDATRHASMVGDSELEYQQHNWDHLLEG
jgi:hypothetical protein